MKSLIISLVSIILLIAVPIEVHAQMGMMGLDSDDIESRQETDIHSEEIDEVLENILQAHSVSKISDLNCDQVTDDELERLGEAWMGVVHPDEKVHERMDAMMGGEGSETLKTAHINMGKRYLGCFAFSGGRWSNPMGMMPMAGMMGTSWGTGGISAGVGLFWLFWITTILLFDVLLVALIRYFWKKADRKR